MLAQDAALTRKTWRSTASCARHRPRVLTSARQGDLWVSSPRETTQRRSAGGHVRWRTIVPLAGPRFMEVRAFHLGGTCLAFSPRIAIGPPVELRARACALHVGGNTVR